MKAKAIQVIAECETHRQLFPGEHLDGLPAELVNSYVKDGLAAWVVEDEPPKRRRKSGQGEDEVSNGDR